MMVMEDNTRYITNRIWHKILLPALLSNLFNLISLHFGMFFLVFRFCPKTELIVYSAFLPFWFFFFVFEYLFSIAGSQYFSICKGAGNHAAAQKVFEEVFATQLLLTAAGSLLAAWLMPQIIRFLNLPPENVPMALKYGRLLFFCGMMDAVVTMLRLFIQADSLPRTGSAGAIFQSIVLVLSMYICFCVLHYGLIEYYLFFLFLAFLMTGIYCMIFICRKTTLKLGFRIISWQTFMKLASLSGNNIINNGGIFVISLLTTRWLMSVFGQASITIFALLSMLTTCCDYLQDAYISSAQSLIGVCYGEGNRNGISLVYRKGFRSGLYIQLGFMLFLLCFPEFVKSAFSGVMENFPGEAVLAIRLFALSILFRYVYCFFSSCYVICGHDKFVNFCAVAGNLFVYFSVVVFFLLILRNVRIYWWYYPVSWMCILATCFAAVCWKKKRENFQNYLLLPQFKTTGKSCYFLLQKKTDDFMDYRMMLDLFLRKHSICGKNAGRINHLFEELFIFAGERIGTREDAFFSIVITLQDRNVELTMRYDSRESCLKSVLNTSRTTLKPEQVAGAKLLASMSDDIYIDRIYGINFISLILHLD